MGELLETTERVPVAEFGSSRPVEQLQKLKNELDVSDPSSTGFEVGFQLSRSVGVRFDPPFDRLDFTDLNEGQLITENEFLDLAEESLTQRLIACDGTCLDHRLPFPRPTFAVV